MTEVEEKGEGEREGEREREREREGEREREREREGEREEKADAHGAVVASWGFPRFARGFPRDPELDALVEAFAKGDYLTIRERAPKLAESPDATEDVKRAAKLLRARIEPDKTARTFFALTTALLVFLTVWWVTHDGPEHHGPAPVVPPPTVEYVK